MNEKQILERIGKLTKREKAQSELIDAKIVSIKQPRVCRGCIAEFKPGTRMITANHLVDKKYSIPYNIVPHSYKGDYNFVPSRHWFCLACANKAIDSIKDTNGYYSEYNKRSYQNIPFDEISLENYDEETQLEIIKHAYENGELDSSEYQELENSIIHFIALRDAEGLQ